MTLSPEMEVWQAADIETVAQRWSFACSTWNYPAAARLRRGWKQVCKEAAQSPRSYLRKVEIGRFGPPLVGYSGPS